MKNLKCLIGTVKLRSPYFSKNLKKFLNFHLGTTRTPIIFYIVTFYCRVWHSASFLAHCCFQTVENIAFDTNIMFTAPSRKWINQSICTWEKARERERERYQPGIINNDFRLWLTQRNFHQKVHCMHIYTGRRAVFACYVVKDSWVRLVMSKESINNFISSYFVREARKQHTHFASINHCAPSIDCIFCFN